MASKITTQISLLWSDGGGDQVKGTISNTVTQSGTKAMANVQNIGTSSEQIDLGDVTGAKLVMFENRDTTNPIYIDTANPATTAASIKLNPAGQAGCGTCFQTTVDSWYAIATGSAADLGVTAMQV